MSNSHRYIEQALEKAFGSSLGKDNLGTIIMVFAIICLGVLYAIVRYSTMYTDISPLSFVASRFIVETIFMILFHFIMRCLENPQEEEPSPKFWCDLALWGSLMSFFLLGFSIAIQYAEVTQSAAQTSFIVGMYVVVIPFVEATLSSFSIAFSWRSWVAIALDIPGLVLLSGCTEYDCFSSAAWGVLINLGAMFCVVGQTLVSARGVNAIGSRPMMLAGFVLSALVSTILALIIEPAEFPLLGQYWFLIVSSALAEVLSISCITVALAFLSTSRAAIVMSTESVSGAVFGFIILGETLTGFEYLGAALMLIAVIVELSPGCTTEEEDKAEEGVVLAASESTPLMDVEDARRRRLSF